MAAGKVPVRLVRNFWLFVCLVLLASGARAGSDLAISSLAQRGMHHELTREVRQEEARANLERLRGVSTFLANIGPEKYIAMARIHMAVTEFDKALEAVDDPGANVSPILTIFYDPTFQNLPKFFIRCKSLFET